MDRRPTLRGVWIMYQYFDKIRDILDTVEIEEKANIDLAVSAISEAILNKKSLFSFGASHAGDRKSVV